MRAGRRDMLILIQEPVETVNGYGESEIQWIDHSEPWAFISYDKGREYFADQQINNINPVEITINYSKYIKDTFRIIFDNRIFEIKNVISIRKRNESKMICSEIT